MDTLLVFITYFVANLNPSSESSESETLKYFEAMANSADFSKLNQNFKKTS